MVEVQVSTASGRRRSRNASARIEADGHPAPARAPRRGQPAPVKPATPRRSGARDLLLGWRTEGAARRTMGFADPSGTPSDSAQARADEAVVAAGEGHLITIAPTGAGKGRGAIIPNLLRYEGPVIVVDPKGENYRVTARARREMGHEVHVLDPFGITGAPSGALNPLDALQRPGADLESEARALAHLLSGQSSNLKEPFWDIWGRALVAGVAAYVSQHNRPEHRHFGRVRALLKNDDVVFNLAKVLDETDGLEGLARTEIAAFLQLVEQTRSGVLATAQSYTDVVNCGPAQQALARTSLDLQAVAGGAPLSIYLVLPPDKLASHGALLRLWIGTLLKMVVTRTRRPEQDTLFILDECAQLGPLEELRAAMTLLRGYGLRVWAFFQDLSQLRRLYPQDWQTMLNNAAVFQAFGVSNHVMATELAEILGDVDAFALRALARDAQVLARAREPAQVCRLPDYLIDPMFARRFDPNPMFAGPVAGR